MNSQQTRRGYDTPADPQMERAAKSADIFADHFVTACFFVGRFCTRVVCLLFAALQRKLQRGPAGPNDPKPS